MIAGDYAALNPAGAAVPGKFYLQSSSSDAKTPKGSAAESPKGAVHTPHSLEFSTKRRIFDKGPEVIELSSLFVGA